MQNLKYRRDCYQYSIIHDTTQCVNTLHTYRNRIGSDRLSKQFACKTANWLLLTKYEENSIDNKIYKSNSHTDLV